MKRIIFFLILMISITTAAQDDYRPLLKDGKVWHEVSYNAGGNKCETTYRVDGETVVDGKRYFNIYCKYVFYNAIGYENGKGYIYSDEGEEVEESLICLLCEEDGRIYRRGNNEDRLLYDFNVEVGEVVYSEVFVGDKGTGNYGELKKWVSGIDFIESAVGSVKRICMKYEAAIYNEGELGLLQTEDFYIIEGVGNSLGLLRPVYEGLIVGSSNNHLVDCLEDGKSICTIADYDPLYAAASVSDVHMQRPATSQIFDLQGRRLSGAPTRGLYIKDGKKHVVR